jgi:peptidoglycan hydrolase CwlO-like protein
VITKKDEDIDAYRRQVIEFEKIIRAKEEALSDLQTKIITLSHEVTEKDMEIEFYSSSIEELRTELAKA